MQKIVLIFLVIFVLVASSRQTSADEAKDVSVEAPEGYAKTVVDLFELIQQWKKENNNNAQGGIKSM